MLGVRVLAYELEILTLSNGDRSSPSLGTSTTLVEEAALDTSKPTKRFRQATFEYRNDNSGCPNGLFLQTYTQQHAYQMKLLTSIAYGSTTINIDYQDGSSGYIEADKKIQAGHIVNIGTIIQVAPMVCSSKAGA